MTTAFVATASVDFRHATELIGRAHRSAHSWLDSGGDRRTHPGRFLALHRHPGPALATAHQHGGHAA